MARLENIRASFKSVQTRTKAFFHGERWKEALVFLLFVFLAFCFWMLQSLQQEYEIELAFPVRYENVPADIAFDTPRIQEITAKVKDKGSVLLNYTIGRNFAPIEVKMGDITRKNGSIQVGRKQIESDIQKQLISTTSLLGFEPQAISLRFSKREEKEIPVTFGGEIRPKAGFQLSGEIRITPPYVKAYATASILDTLAEASTEPEIFSEVDKKITKTIRLSKIKGVNLTPESVTVTIPVEQYTEKTLRIPVTCEYLPPHYNIRIFPATIEVTCGVPLSRFKELSEEMFSIQIPYKELEQNVSGSLPVKLSKKPDWVHSATLQPDKIEFILEHTDTP